MQNKRTSISFSRVIIPLFIIMFLSIIVISNPPVDAIGDTSEDLTDKTEGEINYTEIRTKEIIGFETVYKQEEYFVEECNYTTLENITLIGCYNETYYRQVVDGSKKGDPIYSYSDINSLEYDGKRTDFIGKGCFFCESVEFEGSETVYSGKLMLCLPDTEYRPGIKSCWIESGSSYIINDLDTGKILYSHLDNGVKIG